MELSRESGYIFHGQGRLVTPIRRGGPNRILMAVSFSRQHEDTLRDRPSRTPYQFTNLQPIRTGYGRRDNITPTERALDSLDTSSHAARFARRTGKRSNPVAVIMHYSGYELHATV